MSKTATKPAKAETNGGEAPALIAIDRIEEETLRIPITGVTPAIVHKFAQKAKQQMLDAAQGRRTPKTPKDPQAEYEACFYYLASGGYGFPADGFKQATVGAARFYGKQLTMTALKQFIFFRGEIGDDGRQMVEIVGEPKMRDDVVRVGRGGSENRYRPQFFPWTATLEVSYFTAVLTRNSVLSLIDAGGMAVGVGEWRPEKGGTFGTYKINVEQDIEIVGV